MSLYQKYLASLRDPHAIINNLYNKKSIDFVLRNLIGKTDKLEVAKCSHASILKNELPDDENRCRQCGMKLGVGIGRWNDYLVLRHPKCTRPICVECAKNRPDIFHLAFRKGLEKFENFKKIINECVDINLEYEEGQDYLDKKEVYL